MSSKRINPLLTPSLSLGRTKFSSPTEALAEVEEEDEALFAQNYVEILQYLNSKKGNFQTN